MTRPRHHRTARHGFTLVELMVATALVVLILTILAVAFGAASDSLSRLRSMGNMATQLRTTQDRLRGDWEAQHFEPGESPGPLRLADVRYDWIGTANAASVQTPIGGFVRIDSGGGSIFEGQDADGMLSTRANALPTSVGHSVEFTTKLQGRTPDDLYVVPATTAGILVQNVSDTPLAPGLFAGKWARVRWYLDNPQTMNGVQVWTLYRCVRAITPTSVANLTADEQDLFAHNLGTSQTLGQLTNPTTRTLAVPGATISRYVAPSLRVGDDIVLTNVTSFEVKPAWDPAPGVRGPRGPGPVPAATLPATLGGAIPDGSVGATVANSDFPFDDLPVSGGARVFDTWNDPNTAPLRVRVTALQVKIRVFDPKTLLTRQVSFIVQP